MAFKLRDYQQDVINRVNELIKEGQNQMLIQAPTGCGKSLIQAEIIRQAILAGKTVAVIAHRSRLLSQLHATIKAHTNYDATFVEAGKKTNYNSRVFLCMAQTLSSKKRQPPKVDVILIDECHITTSFKGCERLIWESMQPVYCLSSTILIGLTATPYRLKKNEGLCRLFGQNIIHTPSPRELMEAGYLTKPVVYVHDSDKLDFTLARESKTEDDYTQKSLDKILNADYTLDVIDKWEAVAPDSKTIIFAGNVKQANLFTKTLNERGYKAVCVTGSMSKAETNVVYDGFADGESQILVGVTKFCEGFDVPSVETVVLARPSKSFALISQMIGRALRLHDNKKQANIIDCSGFLIHVGHMQEVAVEVGVSEIYDFFDQKATSICPTKKFKGEMPSKTCQNADCQQDIPVPALICPHCNHKQEILQKEKVLMEFPQLIQIEGKGFKQLKKEFRFLQKEMQHHFNNMLSPSRVEDSFMERYASFPEDEYYLGAVFGQEDSDINKSAYSYYLAVSCRGNLDKIRKYFKLEFGTNTELVKPLAPSQYLGITNDKSKLSRRIVDDAYFKLAAEAKGNGAKVLNMCYTEVIRRLGMEL